MIWPNKHAYIVLNDNNKLDVVSSAQHFKNIDDFFNSGVMLSYIVIDMADCPDDGYGYYVMRYKHDSGQTHFVSVYSPDAESAKNYFKNLLPNAADRRFTDLTHRFLDAKIQSQYLPSLYNGTIKDELISLRIESVQQLIPKLKKKYGI